MSNSVQRRLTIASQFWTDQTLNRPGAIHVAQLTDLHWHTIKAIDHQRLQRQHG